MTDSLDDDIDAFVEEQIDRAHRAEDALAAALAEIERLRGANNWPIANIAKLIEQRDAALNAEAINMNRMLAWRACAEMFTDNIHSWDECEAELRRLRLGS